MYFTVTLEMLQKTFYRVTAFIYEAWLACSGVLLYSFAAYWAVQRTEGQDSCLLF